MIYIYTLSYNGVVFYIGQSKNPVMRYCAHLGSSEILPYIFKKIKKGKYPTLSIINHTKSRKIANRLEGDAVLNCVKQCVKLINGSLNPIFNQIAVPDNVEYDRTLKFSHFHEQAQICFYNYVIKHKITCVPNGFIERKLVKAANMIT